MATFTPSVDVGCEPLKPFTARTLERFTKTATPGQNMASGVFDPREIASYEPTWPELTGLSTTINA